VFTTNLTNYYNADVQQVIDDLRRTLDTAKRAAAIERLGLMLDEDLPFVWTGSDLAFVASREPVKGVTTWMLPDKSRGDGAQAGITFWSQVWVKR